MIPIGSTIGILGGGQLGRMLAIAAAPLGYSCHLFCPEDDAPAAEVCAKHTVAKYENVDALMSFAKNIDVVTYEFENVPSSAIQLIEKLRPVRPGKKSLTITSNRRKEKQFAMQNDISVASWQEVKERRFLGSAIKKIGVPSILKSEESGYDGKGQYTITSTENSELDLAWQKVGNVPAILEEKIDFEQEISVIIARGIDNSTKCYSPIFNVHKDGILDYSLSPAPINNRMKKKAEQIAMVAAESLDHIGVLCVELFLTKNKELLLNEIAPRVHNSGHLTIEAYKTSQFTQHIRAIVGLQLRDCLQQSNAAMKNLIGRDIDFWEKMDTNGEPSVHLYGKKEVRTGRKMGHVTWLYPTSQDPYIPIDF